MLPGIYDIITRAGAAYYECHAYSSYPRSLGARVNNIGAQHTCNIEKWHSQLSNIHTCSQHGGHEVWVRKRHRVRVRKLPKRALRASYASWRGDATYVPGVSCVLSSTLKWYVTKISGGGRQKRNENADYEYTECVLVPVVCAAAF